MFTILCFVLRAVGLYCDDIYVCIMAVYVRNVERIIIAIKPDFRRTHQKNNTANEDIKLLNFYIKF